MCSFLFARSSAYLSDQALTATNKYARFRGPDGTSVFRSTDAHGKHLTFLHNLLDISGAARRQPIVSADSQQIIALFNGEIYNYKALGQFETDTDCIIPAYLKFGAQTSPKLDGEFAIAVYDARTNLLTVQCDPFLTKPYYVGTGGGIVDFAVATYASSLSRLGCSEIRMATPNATLQVDFSADGHLIREIVNVIEFSLDQHKNSYDDWVDAFIDAVEKRATHGVHRPVVFLSSGYDSGAICLALNVRGIQYETYSICAGEERSVLKRRIRINKSKSCKRAFRDSGLSPSDIDAMKNDIRANVEPFEYVHQDAPGVISDLMCDGGALGANYLAETVRRNGRVVCLSGSGADEIMSDYGFAGEKFYYHSQFGGLFPARLESIFPWKKFYGDTQRSYLFKDEYILGRHGVEGRFPYLDKRVVQEFLWLESDLKNRAYKGAIEHFLSSHNYPFEPRVKRGFAPRAELSGPRRFFRNLRQ